MQQTLNQGRQPVLDHWLRQKSIVMEASNPSHLDPERVYQLTRLARNPNDRDLIVAMSSKASIQRLVSALAEQQSADRYKVSVFVHPLLPGLER